MQPKTTLEKTISKAGEIGKSALALYMLGCTILVTSALMDKYLKPILSPKPISEEIIYLNGKAHYKKEFEKKTAYTPIGQSGIVKVKLIDENKDGNPDYRIISSPAVLRSWIYFKEKLKD